MADPKTRTKTETKMKQTRKEINAVKKEFLILKNSLSPNQHIFSLIVFNFILIIKCIATLFKNLFIY